MRIKANDTELYYEQYGEGEPIIFSHGWLDDCSVWNSQIELFARNHTVILYDHRGHGKSDKPRWDYSVQALSSDLHSLIQMLKFEKVTLVGFSLGGMAALMFTLQHPAKVAKLVLVGTTAKMAMSIYILYALRYILPYRIFARIVSRIKIYKPSQEIIKDNMSRAMKVPKHAAYRCMVEFTRNYDIRNRVSGIKVPTLIIVGAKDRTNLKASECLNREIEGSTLRVISDSGHSVMIEKLEEFNQLVQQFIAEK
jgi:pimeloyl-ACP methyl ester carboxylesterase